MSTRFLLQIILLIFLAGCQAKPVPEAPEAPREKIQKPLAEPTESSSLQEIPWSELPKAAFQDRSLATWTDALHQSAVYYGRVAADKPFQFGSATFTAAQLRKACTELANVAREGNPEKLKTVLLDRYRLFRSVGNAKGDVLVTGYYEPLLHGSFTRSRRYFYPIYRRPPEPLRHIDRRKIDEPILKKGYTKKPVGALANRKLELLWVDNPIDAFFLHIQGSGRVLLDNGRMMRIGYDGANGRTYVAIGKILIDEGRIPKEEMTMPRLRQWLVDNPRENLRLFFSNPSYVYFREMAVDAVGNINVPLTKERSIATDHRLFPRGAPGILATTFPDFAPNGKTVLGWRPETRFVVNQDTGGAIRGAGRVDLFFGFGDLVEYRAGVMKQNGSQLYFIAPVGP